LIFASAFTPAPPADAEAGDEAKAREDALLLPCLQRVYQAERFEARQKSERRASQRCRRWRRAAIRDYVASDASAKKSALCAARSAAMPQRRAALMLKR